MMCCEPWTVDRGLSTVDCIFCGPWTVDRGLVTIFVASAVSFHFSSR